jgi:hypothetical protein
MNAIVVLLLAAAPDAAGVPFAQSGFAAGVPGWTAQAQRAEIAPRAFVAAEPSRGEPGALALAGERRTDATGGWERRLSGITAGHWYRLTAHYRAQEVAQESWQVLARLDWRAADGARAGQPEYAWRAEPDGGWQRLTLEAPAPEGATSVAVQLQLREGGPGVLYWDDVRLEEVAGPAPRQVSVAAVNLRPRGTASAAESVRAWIAAATASVPAGADVILLSEGIPMVGTGRSYVDVAETVPGPTTAALGELARPGSTSAWGRRSTTPPSSSTGPAGWPGSTARSTCRARRWRGGSPRARPTRSSRPTSARSG